VRKDPVPPDSPATKAALLPARIAWWRKCGADELAAKLESELAAAELELASDMRPEGTQRGAA
jgi:hypothetical protein